MNTVRDEIDTRIVRATQAGLALVAEPYRRVAEQIGVSHAMLIERMRRMLADGCIRRIAAVPDHYRLGYEANAMSVWDVADEAVDALGPAIGVLPFVSHCYRRPRRWPAWPYNLFVMVHGRSRADVEARVGEIGALLGSAARDSDVLYSRRILKKTGLRFS